MDPKSTAKSKRSHSQHGRKSHLTPSAIAQKKKTATTAPSSNRSLPSNWDRYDDEVENTNVSSKQVDDGEVLPKSRGADFGYLLEQARSQPKDSSASDGSKGPSSLDEFSFDFMQGVSSMFSVRGKSLLSLCEDDNFIVDDDHKSSNEMSFLSMDLHALAAQLSKLKLSQRLFIEEDLLPEELIAEDSKTTSKSKELEISELSEIDHGFGSQALLNSQVSQTDANYSNTSLNSMFSAGETSLEGSKSSDHREQPSQREVEESNPRNTSHATKFESTVAEAELDVLLDSFNDIDIPVSMPANEIDTSSAPKSLGFGSIASKSGQSTNQGPDYTRNVAVASIDDSIDDLLEETSVCLKDWKINAPRPKHAPFPENSTSYSTSTNNYNQTTFDSVADLPAESTSLSLRELEHPTSSQQKKGLVSSSRALPPRTMDCFDSWLDTL